MRDQRFIHRIINMSSLHQQLVSQDTIIRRIAIPMFPGYLPIPIIPIKGVLQIQQPIPKQAQPEIRQPTIIILYNTGHLNKRLVILIHQFLIRRILKVAFSHRVHIIEAKQFVLHIQEAIVVGVLRQQIGKFESIRQFRYCKQRGHHDRAEREDAEFLDLRIGYKVDVVVGDETFRQTEGPFDGLLFAADHLHRLPGGFRINAIIPPRVMMVLREILLGHLRDVVDRRQTTQHVQGTPPPPPQIILNEGWEHREDRQ